MTEERVETGPVRVGDDWAGVFIRGDRALYWSLILRSALHRAGDDPINGAVLEGLADTLASCREPCEALALNTAPTPATGGVTEAMVPSIDDITKAAELQFPGKEHDRMVFRLGADWVANKLRAALEAALPASRDAVLEEVAADDPNASERETAAVEGGWSHWLDHKHFSPRQRFFAACRAAIRSLGERGKLVSDVTGRPYHGDVDGDGWL